MGLKTNKIETFSGEDILVDSNIDLNLHELKNVKKINSVDIDAYFDSTKKD